MTEIPIGESNTKSASIEQNIDISKKSEYQLAIEIMLGLQDVDPLMVMATDNNSDTDSVINDSSLINMAKNFRFNFLNILQEGGE